MVTSDWDGAIGGQTPGVQLHRRVLSILNERKRPSTTIPTQNRRLRSVRARRRQASRQTGPWKGQWWRATIASGTEDNRQLTVTYRLADTQEALLGPLSGALDSAG